MGYSPRKMQEAPRKSSVGGLAMLGGGSSQMRPSSGSFMIMPTKKSEKPTEIIPPSSIEAKKEIPEATLQDVGKSKRKKERKRKEKSSRLAEMDNQHPFADIQVEERIVVDAEESNRDKSSEGGSKELQMISGSVIAKDDKRTLLAQGEIGAPEPRFLPMHEEQPTTELGKDLTLQIRKMIKKMIATEDKYQQNLNYITTRIIQPLRQEKILNDGELGLIFFNLEVIATQQDAFSTALRALLADSSSLVDSLYSFLTESNGYFVLHGQFVSNFAASSALASRLILENDLLEDFLLRLVYSDNSRPWLDLEASTKLPVNYILQLWLQLSQLISSLPGKEKERLSRSIVPVKDTLDLIRTHTTLEQSAWPLLQLAETLSMSDPSWLFKPSRAYCCQKAVILKGAQDALEANCYILKDFVAFSSSGPNQTLLGRLKICSSQFRTDSNAHSDSEGRAWLVITEHETSIQLGFLSQVELLDFVDQCRKIQENQRLVFAKRLKLHGSINIASNSAAIDVCENQIIFLGSTENSFSVLDLENKTLTQRPVESLPSTSEFSASISGNSVYIFGGLNGRSTIATLRKLDLSTLRSQELQPSGDVPASRASHRACIIGRKMYIFGGYSRKKKTKVYMNDFWMLDLKRSTWRSIACQDDVSPSARANFAIFSFGTKLYVWGGEYNGEALSDLKSFDLVTNVWKSESPSGVGPTARYNMCYTTFLNYLIIYGGENGVSTFDDIFLLDLTLLLWIKIQPPSKFIELKSMPISVYGGNIVQADAGPLADLSEAFLVLPASETGPLLRIPLSQKYWITPQNVDALAAKRNDRRTKLLSKNKRLKNFFYEASLKPSYHHYRTSASKTAKFNSHCHLLTENRESRSFTSSSASSASLLSLAIRSSSTKVLTFGGKKIQLIPESLDLDRIDVSLCTSRGPSRAFLDFKLSVLIVTNYTTQEKVEVDLLNHHITPEKTTLCLIFCPAVSPIASAHLEFKKDEDRSKIIKDYHTTRATFLGELLGSKSLISVPCIPAGYSRDVHKLILEREGIIVVGDLDSMQRFSWMDLVEINHFNRFENSFVIWKSKSDVFSIQITAKNSDFLYALLQDATPTSDAFKERESNRKFQKWKGKYPKKYAKLVERDEAPQQSGSSQSAESGPRTPRTLLISETDSSSNTIESSKAALTSEPRSATGKRKHADEASII